MSNHEKKEIIDRKTKVQETKVRKKKKKKSRVDSNLQIIGHSVIALKTSNKETIALEVVDSEDLDDESKADNRVILNIIDLDDITPYLDKYTLTHLVSNITQYQEDSFYTLHVIPFVEIQHKWHFYCMSDTPTLYTGVRTEDTSSTEILQSIRFPQYIINYLSKNVDYVITSWLDKQRIIILLVKLCFPDISSINTTLLYDIDYTQARLKDKTNTFYVIEQCLLELEEEEMGWNII